jgi:DNA (cytosine-5)-methyltransferase 1
MKYGSVCSGIEAASVAWHNLGWEPQWFSEIEQFPSEVLKHRFPAVPNLGDMTTINQNPIADERPIDLLVGGTPCQSFSVAGLRKGLADPRGNLMLTFLSIADKFRPKWVVWENVPGVLSSNGGRDFGTFLGALGELGYGFAYRVLDAQHFGVAQRRRRVFVVGYLGDWRVAAAVLFERESLQGNTKPSRKKREEVTANAEGSVGEAGSWWDGSQVAGTLTKQNANGAQRMPDKDNFGAILQPTIIDRAAFNQGENAQYEPRIEAGETMSSLVAKGPHAVAQPIAFKVRGGCEGGGKGYLGQEEQAFTISTMQDQQIAQPMAFDWQSGGDMRGMNLQEKTQLQRCQTPAIMHSMAIRRLTPKECERLQGFPDDWTKIPYRNKEADQCPDGPRYKACGNSMAVPVMRWIGERINLIESIL